MLPAFPPERYVLPICVNFRHFCVNFGRHRPRTQSVDAAICALLRVAQWYIERRSLVGELPLSRSGPSADGVDKSSTSFNWLG